MLVADNTHVRFKSSSLIVVVRLLGLRFCIYLLNHRHFDLEKGAARQVPWKSISSIKFVWKMTENWFSEPIFSWKLNFPWKLIFNEIQFAMANGYLYLFLIEQTLFIGKRCMVKAVGLQLKIYFHCLNTDLHLFPFAVAHYIAGKLVFLWFSVYF